MQAAECIDVELVQRRTEIPIGAGEWNALVARNETNSIFQTYEWFDAWWQAFGARNELFFLVLRCRNEIIGFAPLAITPERQLQFIGTGNADYLDFVIASHRREALRSVCDFLHQHRGRWDDARLCNLPARSSSLDLLREAAKRSRLHLVDEARLRCPALLLHDEHREPALQLIGRYSMRRRLNWFQKHGVLRFRHLTSLDEIRALLPTFFDQHVGRWRALGKRSLFEQGSQRDFYSGLAATMHQTGWLLFSVLEFNGAPIAFHFGFDYARRIIWYKPAFNVAFAANSPGLVLTRQLIEDGLARQRHEIDFTIGEEAFKERFANVERANAFLALYHSTPRWLMARSVREVRRRFGRILRTVRGWSRVRSRDSQAVARE